VPDFQGEASTAQMQPAVDDEAATHPDLSRHDIEHLRSATARTVPRFGESGEVCVISDRQPDAPVTTARKQVGEQAANRHRLRPIEGMCG
jgi:hypothetical protein